MVANEEFETFAVNIEPEWRFMTQKTESSRLPIRASNLRAVSET